ncbi:hypothetical protein PUNSTDRAFT_118251 [Punctularia strigosozonata HHB-11173 SS5]|uniref:uncharacterized protein n=1 Tax=Punctularia strigosozonata (strain HHB-11173) TaxID=741275 RepID=UPI00044180EC|nr:uncharacterized protein PUNSTDRAFT_118251 [Punctularia strigosozonata HHB-11173 SS5]EIN12390.1 hypothetical protein PUNSTDRAFT_118251 [Punctularia strigosozonata HHB-11173 SS5]
MRVGARRKECEGSEHHAQHEADRCPTRGGARHHVRQRLAIRCRLYIAVRWRCRRRWLDETRSRETSVFLARAGPSSVTGSHPLSWPALAQLVFTRESRTFYRFAYDMATKKIAAGRQLNLNIAAR